MARLTAAATPDHLRAVALDTTSPPYLRGPLYLRVMLREQDPPEPDSSWSTVTDCSVLVDGRLHESTWTTDEHPLITVSDPVDLPDGEHEIVVTVAHADGATTVHTGRLIVGVEPPEPEDEETADG